MKAKTKKKTPRRKVALDIIIGLGSRLKAWRKDQNPPLKGFQLAKKIKVSQGSLSEIENSKSNPSAVTIFKLMNETPINIYWLLTGEHKKSNSNGRGNPK